MKAKDIQRGEWYLVLHTDLKCRPMIRTLWRMLVVDVKKDGSVVAQTPKWVHDPSVPCSEATRRSTNCHSIQVLVLREVRATRVVRPCEPPAGFESKVPAPPEPKPTASREEIDALRRGEQIGFEDEFAAAPI